MRLARARIHEPELKRKCFEFKTISSVIMFAFAGSLSKHIAPAIVVCTRCKRRAIQYFAG
jgi:hypothetical protein